MVVDYASLWPFFSLALQIVEQQPARQVEMGSRIFRAAQLIRQSITAQTVAGAAALLGEGDGAKAQAVRAWRDANERYGTLKQVARAQAEAARLREARDRIAPEYQSAIASPVSLSAVQAVLGEGEALVRVLAGWPRSLLLIVDRDGVTYSDMPVTDSQISVLVGLLRPGIETDREGRVPAFQAGISHQLFNLLFSAQREELMRHERLIFSTSGALQSLPLELLTTAPPAGDWQAGDYTQVPWLGAERSVSYVPSPRNLVDIRARAGSSGAAGAVASFSDFRSGVDPRKVLAVSRLPDACLRLAEAVDRVGELPGTAQEAQVISDIFGAQARLATGADFNEDAVKAASADGTLADYKVLHFATHGILWPTPDRFTDPALTVTATESEDSDGLLTASEIRLMNLDAQLVVLSACNTASGYLTQASESLYGAGARAGMTTGAGGKSPLMEVAPTSGSIAAAVIALFAAGLLIRDGGLVMASMILILAVPVAVWRFGFSG